MDWTDVVGTILIFLVLALLVYLVVSIWQYGQEIEQAKQICYDAGYGRLIIDKYNFDRKYCAKMVDGVEIIILLELIEKERE
jgi:hypothetical protein